MLATRRSIVFVFMAMSPAWGEFCLVVLSALSSAFRLPGALQLMLLYRRLMNASNWQACFTLMAVQESDTKALNNGVSDLTASLRYDGEPA